MVNGSSFILLKPNSLPENGTCEVNKLNGTALQTYFTIACVNWQDEDGDVVKYEFFATYKNCLFDMALNYATNGMIVFQLPAGPSDDDHKIFLYAKIIDNAGGLTVFNLPTPVQVVENKALTDSLMSQILSNSPNSDFLNKIQTGSLQESSKSILAISTMINMDTSSSQSSTNGSSSEDDEAVNQRKKVREQLMNVVSGFTISDLSSIRLVTSVLSSLASNPNEISTTSSVIIRKKLFFF